MQKNSPFTWFLYWKLPIDTDFIHFICQFHQSFGINARVFSGWASCISARHAGSFDCLMTSLILITMDNGRWHCAWWQSCKVPYQTHRGIKKWKMYAIKQIKICAEYRDMLPRPRLDLSGTPGLRPIGLSPGSWQTSLGLGSMSRYSAQILICIIQIWWTFRFALSLPTFNHVIATSIQFTGISCEWHDNWHVARAKFVAIRCSLINTAFCLHRPTLCSVYQNVLQTLSLWRIYASVNQAIIGSDNGLSPGPCQAIIWTNAGI